MDSGRGPFLYMYVYSHTSTVQSMQYRHMYLLDCKSFIVLDVDINTRMGQECSYTVDPTLLGMLIIFIIPGSHM